MIAFFKGSLPLKAIIAALFLLLSRPAGATVVERKDLQALTAESGLVVMGRVVKRESRYGEKGKRIFTYTTMKVERTLRGETGAEEIVVRTLGGEVGEVGMAAQGVCSFSKGEETVLFLRKLKGGEYIVNGLSQGKLPVVRAENGEALVVTNPATPGLIYAKSVGAGGEDNDRPKIMNLDDFEALVRSF